MDARDRAKNPGAKVLVDDSKLCQRLTENLHLDDFFLTHEAWNSNGFLLSQHGWGASENVVYSKYAQILKLRLGS
jgi:hypothetical protein